MTAKHPEAFIEQALVKAYSRGDRTIKSVAEDLNVNHHTLKYWMKNKAVTKSGVSATREKRPQDWTAEEQLVALHETHGEAIVAGARQERACEVISLSERTLRRWQNDQAEGACDRRQARVQTPKNRLSELERRRLLAIANSPEFGHLSPSQIVPRLVNRGSTSPLNRRSTAY
jgi:hypothetical protein